MSDIQIGTLKDQLVGVDRYHPEDALYMILSYQKKRSGEERQRMEAMFTSDEWKALYKNTTEPPPEQMFKEWTSKAVKVETDREEIGWYHWRIAVPSVATMAEVKDFILQGTNTHVGLHSISPTLYYELTPVETFHITYTYNDSDDVVDLLDIEGAIEDDGDVNTSSATEVICHSTALFMGLWAKKSIGGDANERKSLMYWAHPTQLDIQQFKITAIKTKPQTYGDDDDEASDEARNKLVQFGGEMYDYTLSSSKKQLPWLWIGFGALLLMVLIAVATFLMNRQSGTPM